VPLSEDDQHGARRPGGERGDRLHDQQPRDEAIVDGEREVGSRFGEVADESPCRAGRQLPDVGRNDELGEEGGRQ